jgi:hypothetical protein
MALAPEWVRTLAVSTAEKSGKMGTATAPIKVIEKKAELQFGMLLLRTAILSPGFTQIFSSMAINAFI